MLAGYCALYGCFSRSFRLVGECGVDRTRAEGTALPWPSLPENAHQADDLFKMWFSDLDGHHGGLPFA